MKRLTAVLAAAILAISVSAYAFAVPEQSAESSAPESSAVTSSENPEAESSAEESSETSEQSEQSKTETSPDESSEETVSAPDETAASGFVRYTVEEAGMDIDIPVGMHILTPDISEKDPALTAAKLTREEVIKSFAQSDTFLKAFASDFSYDITVTVTGNDRTKAIGNLTSLADKEVDRLAESLLDNEYAKGCSKNMYANTLFLTLELEYTSGSSRTYAIQEYTIVKDKNVIITLQSHDNKVSDDLRSEFMNIMTGLSFGGIGTTPAVENPGNAQVNELDIRYFIIMGAAVISIIALAAIIITAVRYRSSGRKKINENEKETEVIIKKPNTSLRLEDEDDKSIQTVKDEQSSLDDEIFKPVDEDVLYKNEKLAEKKKQKEASRNIPRLDATTELEIPKNPYTPVGKAEPVAQPALSVTSEIAKLSIINSEAAKASGEKPAPADDEEVVIAESAPKQKTSIEQIGESVFEKQKDKQNIQEQTVQPEIKTEIEKPETKKPEPEKTEELSEYERRFGKNRAVSASSVSAATIVPVDEDEKRQSKFEKHFGRPEPAVEPKNTQNDVLTAVDVIFGEGEALSPSQPEPETTPAAVTENDKAEKPTVQPVIEESKKETNVTEPSDEAQEKQSLLTKMKNKVFNIENDSAYVDSVEPPLTGKESKNKFIDSLKDKLRNRNIETENEAVDSPDVQTAGETEIYRSPDANKNRKIELSLKKGEDGRIIIDSISDNTGKPVQIELKDGDAEIRAKEEALIEESEKKAEKEVFEEPAKEPENEPETVAEEQPAKEPEKKAESAEAEVTSEKADEEPIAEELSEKEAPADTAVEKETETITEETKKTEETEITKPEDEIGPVGSRFNALFGADRKQPEEPVVQDEIPAEPEPAKEEDDGLSEYEKKFGKNKPAAQSDAAEAKDIPAAVPETPVVPAAAIEAPAAVGAGIRLTKEEAMKLISGAVKRDEAEKPSEDEEKAPDAAAEENASPVIERVEETEKAAETEETTVMDNTEPEPENVSEAVVEEEKSEPIADAAETVAPEEPEETAAPEEIQENEADTEAQTEAEPVTEEAPVQPERPAFIFERDAGIIFEHAPVQEKSIEKKSSIFTTIPRLESVNAEDYNKLYEEMKKEPEPEQPKTEYEKKFGTPQTAAPAANDNKIDFYTGYEEQPEGSSGADQGITLKELDKKNELSLGAKLKKSFGKLFSNGDEG